MSEYEVGYGKPPKHTRFKKGRSGNPKGRPKGARNFSTDVKAALNEAVKVTQNGRTRTVSTQAATLMRLREKALAGDIKAMDQLLSLARLYNDETIAAAGDLPAHDRALLALYEQRRACGAAGGPTGGPGPDPRPAHPDAPTKTRRENGEGEG